MDLQHKSPEELQKLIAAAQIELDNRQYNLRKDVIAQMKELAAEIGVVVEIVEINKTGKSTTMVAAKYRNPHDPNKTWTGRGLAPKWMQALIAAGHSKEEFLINH